MSWDKHFVVKIDDGKQVRFGVHLNDSEVVIYQLSRQPAPPADILLALAPAIPLEWPKKPYHIEARYGMSGCVNYLCREMNDGNLLPDRPIVCRLHISCAEKLNEGASIPLAYYHLLCQKIWGENWFEAPEPAMNEVEIFEPPEGWCSPGEPENW